MSKLLHRKSKLVVETENCVWERRKTRAIIVELKPDYMALRVKGTRTVYFLSYTSALNMAISKEIARKAKNKGSR